MQLTLSSRHVKSSYVGSINVRACHMNSIYISYGIGVRQFLPLYTFYMYIKTSLRLKYNDLKKRRLSFKDLLGVPPPPSQKFTLLKKNHSIKLSKIGIWTRPSLSEFPFPLPNGKKKSKSAHISYSWVKFNLFAM